MDFLTVPKLSFIIDPRNPKQLKNLTLSGFRKVDVKKALEESIYKNNLEESCRWTAELHISGAIEDFWEVIFSIMAKLINIMNPNIYLWVWNRYQKYKHISQWIQKKYLYELRNNQEIRNLVCEIVSIVTLSKKNKLLLNPPPIFETDFHQQIIKDHSVAEDFQEINNFTTSEDDQEVILACNEILNVLKFNMNTSAIYWYHWLDKLTQLKKKEKRKINCLKRKINQISETHWNDWVWIIWNILLDISKKAGRVERHIKILYQMYKHNFNLTTRKHKHNILSTAILFIKYDMNEQLDWKTPVIRHYNYFIQAIGNINLIYYNIDQKLIKNFDTELYYQNIKTSNLASTQFKKYLKKFEKEYNNEAMESKYKAKLFQEMVPYENNQKTNQSLKQVYQKSTETKIPEIDYNLIRKSKKYVGPTIERNILEYYQQPNTESIESTDKIMEWESKYNTKKTYQKGFINKDSEEKEKKKDKIYLSEIPITKKKSTGDHVHTTDIKCMHPENLNVEKIKEIDSIQNKITKNFMENGDTKEIAMENKVEKVEIKEITL